MKKKIFPELFQVASTGKLKVWKIWCEDGIIKELHGYEGGKLIPETIEVKIKNVGRANETTLFEQACSQAQSKWNRKKDKGYTEKGEKANDQVILPMLAVNFKDRYHDIVYPAFLQPKLNGIRMVYNDSYQSRLGKFWNTLGHLDADVKKLRKAVGFPLDGEIFIKDLNLQDIGALVKKERIDETVEGYKTEDLQYWIFDYIDPSATFSEREKKLRAAFGTVNGVQITSVGNLRLVVTHEINSEEEISKWHSSFIGSGFEGTIIRNNTPYEIGKRTKNLQKKKDWMDAEFEIIGGKEANSGRMSGCCVFRCKTTEGNEFDVFPIGTIKQKRQYLKDLDSLIGKKLTCRYQEMTKSPSVPFHARGLAIRDIE